MSIVSRTKHKAFVVMLVTLSAGGAASAAEPARFPMDEAMVHRLKVAHPKAAEAFFEGEERLWAGDFQQAEELFRKVVSEVPRNGIALRRHCQTLIELGRRPDALFVCRRALETGATPMDQRAMVAALMLGTGPVPLNELNEAIRLAAFAKERLHDQPWGFAAECDIARRLRDEPAYKKCLENLERVVPAHYETRRALALAPEPNPWPRRIGWGLLAGAIVATLLHAARRRLRTLAQPATRAAPTVVLLVLVAPSNLRAQATQYPGTPAAGAAAPASEAPWQLSRWRINVNDPESSVPTPAMRDTNPLEFGYHMQDLAAEAARAEQKGDYYEAVKYWRAIAKAVPDSNAGFFRACGAYEKLRDREKALEYCGKGLTLPPEYHSSEASRYAKLVLSKEGALDDVEIYTLDQVTQHLRDSKRPLAAYYSEQIQCDLALKLEDERRLANCTANLVKLAPDDPRTISYRWSLAIRREDLAGAAAAIEHARKTKMQPQAIDVLERGLELATKARRDRWLRIGLGVAGGLLAFVLGFVVLRRFIAGRGNARRSRISTASMEPVGLPEAEQRSATR